MDAFYDIGLATRSTHGHTELYILGGQIDKGLKTSRVKMMTANVNQMVNGQKVHLALQNYMATQYIRGADAVFK